jgi:thymidylate synthase (FAD)
MKVTLVASTPNALQLAFTAIRTCYSNRDFAGIWNEDFAAYKKNNNDHLRLLKQIIKHGHTSTLEHITFTFSIEGISRACLAQLTRHRMASYSVRSQRYVRTDKGIPWAEGATPIESHPRVQKFLKDADELYNALLTIGYRAEDARMILPNQAATNLVMTINLRSFMNMYRVRYKNGAAQKEISNLVEEMYKLITIAEPWIKDVFEEDGLI